MISDGKWVFIIVVKCFVFWWCNDLVILFNFNKVDIEWKFLVVVIFFCCRMGVCIFLFMLMLINVLCFIVVECDKMWFFVRSGFFVSVYVNV